MPAMTGKRGLTCSKRRCFESELSHRFMLLIIKNTEAVTPQSSGVRDILIAAEKIAHSEDHIELPLSLAETIDGTGLIAVPGFIDGHVHITGGGGEGGFHTRTPELLVSDAVRGGITTIVGCLGTDGTTRSLAGLLAKARGLEAEGISTFICSGSYGVPLQTITGSIEKDLILIDKVIGVGEIALSDHRSSQPSIDEISRIAAEARRGGMLAGKSGVVNVHLGDGPRGLQFLERIIAETEIPSSQFLPTHINRNRKLFESAVGFAQRGGYVDFTTSTVPHFLDDGEIKCSTALRQMLESGVNVNQISFSSDGQGSMPDFDASGMLKGLTVGRVTSLWEEVRDAVLIEKIPLETALRVITLNPAKLLHLRRKGEIRPGYDADIVLLKKDSLTIDSVISRGKVLMRHGDLLAKGTFE